MMLTFRRKNKWPTLAECIPDEKLRDICVRRLQPGQMIQPTPLRIPLYLGKFPYSRLADKPLPTGKKTKRGRR